LCRWPGGGGTWPGVTLSTANAAAAAAFYQQAALTTASAASGESDPATAAAWAAFYASKQHASASTPAAAATSSTATGAHTSLPGSTSSDRYLYDATSGYYYDTLTKLYYDTRSQLFYNTADASWCSYDATTGTYTPAAAPSQSQTTQPSSDTAAAQPQTASTSTSQQPADASTSSGSSSVPETSQDSSASSSAAAVLSVSETSTTSSELAPPPPRLPSQPPPPAPFPDSATETSGATPQAPAPASAIPSSKERQAVSLSFQATKKPTAKTTQLLGRAKKIAEDVEKWKKKLAEEKGEAGPTTPAPEPTSTQQHSVQSLSNDREQTMNDASLEAPSNHDPTASASLPSSSFQTEFDMAWQQWALQQLDFVNNICILCKRKFNSADILRKHSEASELHKKNVEETKQAAAAQQAQAAATAAAAAASEYRDRAAERRQTYGQGRHDVHLGGQAEHTDVKRKQRSISPAAPMPKSVPESIADDNTGNKMLRGSGNSAPNQVHGKSSERMGLGMASSLAQMERDPKMERDPNDTYAETVRKHMARRFEELNAEEEAKRRKIELG